MVEPVPTVAGTGVVQNNGHGRPARFGAVGRSARTVSFAGGLLYFIVVQVPPFFFFFFFFNSFVLVVSHVHARLM